MAGGERTIAPVPKEDDDIVHTIWKVSIQFNPKYFGESMHLIVPAWLQTAVMIIEKKKVYIKKPKQKQTTKKKTTKNKHKKQKIPILKKKTHII